MFVSRQEIRIWEAEGKESEGENALALRAELYKSVKLRKKT